MKKVLSSKVVCPKCGSEDYFVTKKGMPWGEIAIFFVINLFTLGIFIWLLIFLLPSWLANANKLEWVCCRCGHKWNNKKFM